MYVSCYQFYLANILSLCIHLLCECSLGSYIKCTLKDLIEQKEIYKNTDTYTVTMSCNDKAMQNI